MADVRNASLLDARSGCHALSLLRIPNKRCFWIEVRKFLCESVALQGQGSKTYVKASRGGTRIPCDIPVTLTSLEPNDFFSHDCQIILANLNGCAARSTRPVAAGTSVRLDGLPTSTPVAARVMNCISLGEHEKLWLLGLALRTSGNVWGITSVPADWEQTA